MDLNELKKPKNIYSSLGLKQNPFSIAPLFRDFRNVRECEKDENLFFIDENYFKEVEILLGTKEQRVLLYGLYGMGKTTLINFYLYLAHNYHRRFCTRIVLTENNLERAVNELLHSLCFDILSEISRKPWSQPVSSIRKWIVENRHGDTLLENLSRLMGRYSEIQRTTETKKNQKAIKVSPGNMGGEWGQEDEIQITKIIQSYIDILPVRKVTEYLKDFQKIVQQLGYEDIILFIDEADHLPKIEQFLRMLTSSRELLFTRGYTYVIAGSVEVARHTESMGAIFDHLLYLEPLTEKAFKRIIEKRLQSQKPSLKSSDIFESESLELIFLKSKGILKEALRLAENSIKNAAKERSNRVMPSHSMEALEQKSEEITLDLQKNHIEILVYLAKIDKVSPSNEKFQKNLSITRSYLRTLLEDLLQKGYLHKEKQGRKTFYSISSQYRPYFARKRK